MANKFYESQINDKFRTAAQKKAKKSPTKRIGIWWWKTPIIDCLAAAHDSPSSEYTKVGEISADGDFTPISKLSKQMTLF